MPVLQRPCVREAKIKRRIETQCRAQGIVLTNQRRLIAHVIAEATDHPDILEVHRRVRAVNERVSLATVYRTVKRFRAAGLIARHTFQDGQSRYEMAPNKHHDHLIDLESGAVIDFECQEIERMQDEIVRRLGFRLLGHRLELYVVPAHSAGARKP